MIKLNYFNKFDWFIKNGNITINNDTYGKSKNKMTIL